MALNSFKHTILFCADTHRLKINLVNKRAEGVSEITEFNDCSEGCSAHMKA